MSERMQSYHALVRSLVRQGASPRSARKRAPRGPEIYAGLVARQHHQALAQMFDALRKRVGEARFASLVERARAQCPPRDPNPSRWARDFAALVCGEASLDAGARALAQYVAQRVDCAIAPDAPREPGSLRPDASLGAFEVDPRALVQDPKADAPGVVLAVYRDDAGRVACAALGPEEVAAWGVMSGEAAPALLSRAGVDAEALARGGARLEALGIIAR